MTTLAVGLGVAILLAGLVLALRGALLAGCASVLLLGTCFNYQLVSFEAGPVTLTLDRLAVLGLAACYALQRWRGRAEPKPLHAADAALAALLGLLVASTWLAGPGSTSGYVPGGWRLVAGYLVPATLYWIARESQLTQRSVTGLVAVLALLGVYLAATAVLERFGRWDLVFPPHIADPALGLHFGRARGPMLHSVSLGLYLGAGGLAAAQRLRRGPGARALLAASIPLFLAALLFTYTRSAYLGVALGVVVWCWLTLPRIWQRILASAVVASLLGVTFAHHGVVSFQRAPSPAAALVERAHSAPPPGTGDASAKPGAPHSAATKQILRGTPAESRESAEVRLVFARVSWQMFQDHPLFGVGLGHFGVEKLPYLEESRIGTRVPSWMTRLEHHNHYLGLLTEAGASGLAAFLAVLGSWLHVAWRLARGAGVPRWAASHGVLLLGVLPIFLVQWCFHELSYAPSDHGLLFLLAGVAVGLRARNGGALSGAAAAGAASSRA